VTGGSATVTCQYPRPRLHQKKKVAAGVSRNSTISSDRIPENIVYSVVGQAKLVEHPGKVLPVTVSSSCPARCAHATKICMLAVHVIFEKTIEDMRKLHQLLMSNSPQELSALQKNRQEYIFHVNLWN